MTTSTGDTGSWQRLGTVLKQRRVTLDQRFRSRKAFAESAGLDYRLIYDIEESRRVNFSVATLTAIEVGYRLTPGSISRFLAGGDLIPPAPPLPASVTFAREHGIDPADPDDPFLPAVREEIVTAIREHGAGATGSQIFHGTPWSHIEATIWNEPGVSLESKELGIAALRARIAELEARRRRSSTAGLALAGTRGT